MRFASEMTRRACVFIYPRKTWSDGWRQVVDAVLLQREYSSAVVRLANTGLLTSNREGESACLRPKEMLQRVVKVGLTC